MRRVIGPATTACLSVALVFSWQPAASAADGISTTVSGYGTVGGTFTSDSDYAYHHDPSEWTAASNPIDIGLESRLGVQVIVDFGSGFSVTGQELAKERAANEFSPGTEWLFVQYSPDADLKLRLGRVVLATFLESDSRNVGYTAPWFNAPNEVYGSEEFDYLDGAQALALRQVTAVPRPRMRLMARPLRSTPSRPITSPFRSNTKICCCESPRLT
jgi:hypothetical protein